MSNFEIYYNIGLLMFCIGTYAYIKNSANLRTNVTLLRFFVTNFFASAIWPLTIPLVLLKSLKD